MRIEQRGVFDALDDKLDTILAKLRIDAAGSEASIAIEIKNAITSIERGLGILVTNTNVKTNKGTAAAVNDANIVQLLDDVRKLEALTRRIDLELRGHSNFDPSKKLPIS